MPSSLSDGKNSSKPQKLAHLPSDFDSLKLTNFEHFSKKDRLCYHHMLLRGRLRLGGLFNAFFLAFVQSYLPVKSNS